MTASKAGSGNDDKPIETNTRTHETTKARHQNLAAGPHDESRAIYRPGFVAVVVLQPCLMTASQYEPIPIAPVMI
jgi:hypothetical protein